MIKAILGIVVGYVALMIFFFVVFTGLYLVLGAERVFQPGTFQISTLWLVLALAGSVCAGMLGGYVCRALSHSLGACRVLAIIVFLLSLAMCWPAITADRAPRARGATPLPTMEAMQQGQAPIWMHLLSVVLSASGVMFGARLKRDS